LKKGISLIEVIIIIAILAILAGIITPLVYNSTESARYKRASEELKSIYSSILGDTEEYFGYLGDMGKFPENLQDLYIKGTQSSPSELGYPNGYPSGSGIMVGWQGPYISSENTDSSGIKDPWGNYYIQVFDAWGNSNRWMIVCSGKDGQFDNTNQSASVNDDNLYYPDEPLTIDSTGSNYTLYNNVNVSASIINSSIQPERVQYTIYYIDNGTAQTQTGIGINGTFTNITVGNHEIRAEFICDDNTTTIGNSVRKIFTLQQSISPDVNIGFNEIYETLSVSFPVPYDNNCPATVTINVDSNLNINGSSPQFDLYFEGYNTDGEKIWGPISMIKSTTSPFFSRTYSGDAPCGIKMLRFFSTGGGATYIYNIQ